MELRGVVAAGGCGHEQATAAQDAVRLTDGTFRLAEVVEHKKGGHGGEAVRRKRQARRIAQHGRAGSVAEQGERQINANPAQCATQQQASEDAVAAAHIQGTPASFAKQAGGYRGMNVPGEAELVDDRASGAEPVGVVIVVQREWAPHSSMVCADAADPNSSRPESAELVRW
jgi:hypothetical protein